MVTIPPNSPPATLNTSTTYVMNIYDQACLDQAESPSSNQSSSGNSSNSDSTDDDQVSQWVQSQFVVYVGAVALNSNDTCQVICQVQSLKQFSILFGPDIRTRSVLVGRVYISSMPDGTSCTSGTDSSNGTCSSGVCGAGGSNETTTESSGSGGTTLTTLAGNGTTPASANVTTAAPAPSG